MSTSLVQLISPTFRYSLHNLADNVTPGVHRLNSKLSDAIRAVRRDLK